jgi:hypothetical protein
MAYTQGLWYAKPETDYVPAQVWQEGLHLCDVYGEDRATRAANARLIAAAPELLAALEDLVRQLPVDERLADFNLDLAEAAVAKAKGLIAHEEETSAASPIHRAS